MSRVCVPPKPPGERRRARRATGLSCGPCSGYRARGRTCWRAPSSSRVGLRVERRRARELDVFLFMIGSYVPGPGVGSPRSLHLPAASAAARLAGPESHAAERGARRVVAARAGRLAEEPGVTGEAERLLPRLGLGGIAESSRAVRTSSERPRKRGQFVIFAARKSLRARAPPVPALRGCTSDGVDPPIIVLWSPSRPLWRTRAADASPESRPPPTYRGRQNCGRPAQRDATAAGSAPPRGHGRRASQLRLADARRGHRLRVQPCAPPPARRRSSPRTSLMSRCCRRRRSPTCAR